LTRQLLAFSRQQVLQPKVHDLNGLVNGVLPMLRRPARENIEVIVSLETIGAKIKIRRDTGSNRSLSTLSSTPATRCAGRPPDHRDTKRSRDWIGGACGRRHRSRDGRSDARAHLRTILHDQKRRQRNRSGAGDRAADRQAVRRQHRVDERAGDRTVFRINLPRVAHSAAAHLESSAPAHAPQGAETVLAGGRRSGGAPAGAHVAGAVRLTVLEAG